MRTQARSLLFEILFSRPWIRLGMISLAALSTTFGLLAPLFQKIFLDRLTGSLAQDALFPAFLMELPPLALLALSFVVFLFALVCSQLVIYIGTRESIWMQRHLAQRLYDHQLELRTESLHGKSVGEIVSIYTVDVPGATILLEQSFPQGLGIFFPLLLGPWVLIRFFDVPSWSLLPFLFAVLIVNFLLAQRQARFFFRFKRLAADRVGYVNEWIQNIRTLRILGWIPSFEQKIFKVRTIETENRISMLNNGQTMNGLASSATFVLNVFLISVLISRSSSISAGTLMGLLWIVAVFLTRPFRQMPWFFTFVFDAWTSLKRVADLMEMENREPLTRSTDFQKLASLSNPDPALRVRGLELELQGHKLLQGIDFDAHLGEFLAIVGAVGSGKSLLLLSLLGETSATTLEYRIGDNDARKLPLDQLRQFFTFVPQEGFIMSATLRENVAFEYGVAAGSDGRIQMSLARAQFDLDKERVSGGLDTEIGERGVNLSGGQKQRVSLGRVDFYESPIVLLDDCLSAVDVDTEKKLIRDLLDGSWKKRTRILVTHRLTILRQVDRILFLENGTVKAVGSFDHLMKTSSEFRDYTASVARSETVSATQAAKPEEEPLITEELDESKRPPDSI